MVCEIAEKLLSEGRNQTLQRYISLFPQEERQHRPWLLYWSGMSRLVFDPITARTDLEAAYQQFERTENNLEGLFLSSSAIIESYHCCVDDMSHTIAWGDRLHQLLLKHNGFPSQGVQAAVMTNLQGLMLACPHHPLLSELEMSIDRVLHSLDNPALRLGVAAGFMYLPLWKGDLSRVRRIVNDVNSYIQGISLPPLPLLIWKVMEANYAWNISDRAQAKERLQEAAAIADEFGIHVFKPMVWGIQTYNALAAGDHREGEVFVDLLNRMTLHHQRLALGQCSYYRAGISLMKGDLKSAYDHVSLALSTTAPLCLPFITGNIRVGLAKVLVELNEMEKAQEQLNAALATARLIGSRTMEVHSEVAPVVWTVFVRS
jgi:tetratricopeptide (TPR) repeat protein